ncbi:hypothetical protein ACJ41O_001125 [Fusarium nematophilum]
MHRKVVLLFIPGLCFLFIATSLYLGRDHLTRLSNLYLPLQHDAVKAEAVEPEPSIPFSAEAYILPTTESLHSLSTTSSLDSLPTTSSLDSLPTTSNLIETPTTKSISLATTATATESASASTSIAVSETASPIIPISNGAILDAKRITPFITAILDPSATEPRRLECPPLDTKRYAPLRKAVHDRESPGDDDGPRIDYFFALDLRNCVDLLPRLLGSVVEAARFLGPERCALSIVEGNSKDGTSDVLEALRPFLADVGLSYFYNRSDINPSKGGRIRKLAQLRNLALKPLFKKKVHVTEDTTVLFINDVAACAEDVLELALQRRNLGADMTCAMDWNFPGTDDPCFYDVWVARLWETGDTFFEIPPNGSWDHAWDLFAKAPKTRARYDAHQPFQVFACWNGATAFTAAPLLHGLKFRDVRGDRDECFQGEPELFCKDMWFRGYGKIAVVPTVNLEYTNERGEDIKRLKGYVGELVRDHEEDSNVIKWKGPPEKVKCMPSFDRQSWRAWNETLR